MPKSISIYASLLFFLFSCGVANKAEDSLTIAVSANVQPLMQELSVLFEKKHKIRLEIISASSGKLVSQISQKAPYDVFLSADMDFPQRLYDKGFSEQAPRVYAKGVLVQWSAKKEFEDEPGSEQIRKIGIAKPELAPYGKKAMEYLKEKGLLHQLQNKLVYSESISQVNQYILSDVVEMAFTSQSAMYIPEIKDKGSWKILDKEIEQGFVVLEYGIKEHPEACTLFTDFLFSEEAREIFKQYGYR